jgi:hypothetical protein
MPYGLLNLLSFSIDLSGLVDFAETIFNSLAGALVPVWGIVLGLGILGLVSAFIMKAVKSKA